ncbi:uncharacterized protein LTR77_008429 [Saxophila tyrrhenica]|uniref:Uncharacterized protein n=1 Tax=Saxophila tyrrhenica TaxID=1690608 RepID=A0AAV9P510_9PEZI|nr:hypothetical protein LTR77_008429 [Saxophila tyrrhenica]
MPVSWTPENDAKLTAKIIQMADVKLNAAQMKELADAMDCTPKAISHRLTHFRKLGGTSSNIATVDPAAKGKAMAAKAKPDKILTPKDANNRVTKPATTKGKKAKTEVKRTPTPTPSPSPSPEAEAAADGEGGEDGKEGYVTPPTTGRKQRDTKRNYASLADESDNDNDDFEGVERSVHDSSVHAGEIKQGEERDEPEVEGLGEDVKIEVGEEIGEGLRMGVEDEERSEEEEAGGYQLY